MKLGLRLGEIFFFLKNYVKMDKIRFRLPGLKLHILLILRLTYVVDCRQKSRKMVYCFLSLLTQMKVSDSDSNVL